MMQWRIHKRNKDWHYLVKKNFEWTEQAVFITYQDKQPVRIWTGLPNDVELLGTVTAKDDVRMAWDVASKILIEGII